MAPWGWSYSRDGQDRFVIKKIIIFSHYLCNIKEIYCWGLLCINGPFQFELLSADKII